MRILLGLLLIFLCTYVNTVNSSNRLFGNGREDEKNPVIFQNILLWDGLNFTDVATKSDCDQLCIDNNCKVANYIGTTDLCFISTTGSQIRNINSNPDLALKGGKCDSGGCNWKNDKIFIPTISFEYSPGQNEVRSSQACFMFCDLTEDCPGFVFHDDDSDSDGKGNECGFFDPGENSIEIPLTGFDSGFKDDSWSTTTLDI